jgi:hypothetical protein
MANAFGTILIIIGIAYGAVKIPQNCFRFASCEDRQRYCEFMVGYHSEKIEEIYFTLELELRLLNKIQADEKISQEYEFELSHLFSLFPVNLIQDLDSSRSDYLPEELISEEKQRLSKKYLVSKNLKLRGIINEYAQNNYRVLELTKEAKKLNFTTKRG